MLDWTIDTCVLYRFAENDFKAIRLLLTIREEKHRVAMDEDGLIRDEYERCRKKSEKEHKPGRELLNKVLVEIYSNCAYIYSGKLGKRNEKHLQRLGVNDEDFPFVFVCSQSNCRRLVSQDSDYNEQVKDYLESKLKVNVLTIAESLEIALKGKSSKFAS
jgi:hypothetical protein